jgi:hypothetical protein
MRRRCRVECPATGAPYAQPQTAEGDGCCEVLRYVGQRRGWSLDRGVSVHPRLRESGRDPGRSACQHPRGDSPLLGSAGGAGVATSYRVPWVYLGQARSWQGLETQWERDARLSTSKTSPWPNAFNWLRTYGIASSRRIRRSHSRLLRLRSSMRGWSSCGAVQTQVSLGRSSATASTVVCGDKSDTPSSRSTGRRSRHRRGGPLVRESCAGPGQRVSSVGGRKYRRNRANAQCLSQSTRRRSSSPAATLPVRTLLLARALGHTTHRVSPCEARPWPMAASDGDRNGRLARPLPGCFGSIQGQAQQSWGAA